MGGTSRQHACTRPGKVRRTCGGLVELQVTVRERARSKRVDVGRPREVLARADDDLAGADLTLLIKLTLAMSELSVLREDGRSGEGVGWGQRRRRRQRSGGLAQRVPVERLHRDSSR